MEKWRDVVGYEGYYQVSSLGRVRSVDRMVQHYRGGLRKMKSRILTTYPRNQSGHLAVALSKEGVVQTIYVHHLVTRAWIGPCLDGQQVRHGPNGKLDNSVSNLCYGTPVEDDLDKWRDGTHLGKPVRRSDVRTVRFLEACAMPQGSQVVEINIFVQFVKVNRKLRVDTVGNMSNDSRGHVSASSHWELRTPRIDSTLTSDPEN